MFYKIYLKKKIRKSLSIYCFVKQLMSYEESHAKF